MKFRESKAGDIVAIYRDVRVRCPYCKTENKVFGGNELDDTSPVADICICKKCDKKFWIYDDQMTYEFSQDEEDEKEGVPKEDRRELDSFMTDKGE